MCVLAVVFCEVNVKFGRNIPLSLNYKEKRINDVEHSLNFDETFLIKEELRIFYVILTVHHR